MIYDLGANPNINVRVASSRLDLMQDVNCRGEVEAPRVLDSLIQDEKKAETEYLRLRTLAPTLEMKNTLTEIAEDEHAHRTFLADARRQFNK